MKKVTFTLTDSNAHNLAIVASILKKPISEILFSALKVQPTRVTRKR